MNKDMKTVCKGNYKIVKYGKEQIIRIYYQGIIALSISMKKSPQYYSRQKLLDMLNTFILEYEENLKKI